MRTPLISVTGDTLPEVIDEHPEMMESKLVVLECTFLDDRKSRAVFPCNLPVANLAEGDPDLGQDRLDPIEHPLYLHVFACGVR